MNGIAKWLSGTTVVGLIAVLSTYGDGAIKALQGLPALIAAFASVMPFGFKSFVLSTLLAALVFAVIYHRTHSKAGAAAEICALGVALIASLLQQRFGPMPSTGATALMSIISGLIAGLGAPFGVRLLESLRASDEPGERAQGG